MKVATTLPAKYPAGYNIFLVVKAWSKKSEAILSSAAYEVSVFFLIVVMITIEKGKEKSLIRFTLAM